MHDNISIRVEQRKKYKTDYERMKSLLKCTAAFCVLLMALLAWTIKGNIALQMRLQDVIVIPPSIQGE